MLLLPTFGLSVRRTARRGAPASDSATRTAGHWPLTLMPITFARAISRTHRAAQPSSQESLQPSPPSRSKRTPPSRHHPQASRRSSSPR